MDGVVEWCQDSTQCSRVGVDDELLTFSIRSAESAALTINQLLEAGPERKRSSGSKVVSVKL